MDDYRIVWDEEAGYWDVSHTERGAVGSVWPVAGGRFEAQASGLTIASGWTLKDAVAQVIWYDRAMNQEAA